MLRAVDLFGRRCQASLSRLRSLRLGLFLPVKRGGVDAAGYDVESPPMPNFRRYCAARVSVACI